MATKQGDLDKLTDELRVWEDALQSWRDQVNKLWREWLIVPGTVDTANPYLSQVRVPYGHYAVETIVPRVIGTDPSMGFRALDTPEDDAVAHLQGALTSWQMERMGFRLEARRFVRQGAICGYTVAKVGWVRQEKDVTHTMHTPQYDPLLDRVFTHQEEQSKKMVVKNTPFIETVNVLDFVFPFTARNLDEAPAVWQRRIVTLGYLRDLEKAGVYANVKDVRASSNPRNDEWRRDQYDHQNVTITANPYAGDTDDDAEVEIWERWTDDNLKVIATPRVAPVLLRDDPNPFWHGHKPFLDWAPIPHPFQMPGVGLIQVLLDLNEDLNTMRRQRRDALTYTLNPAWKTAEGFDQDQLVLFPGKVIEVENMEDLQPAIMPPVDFASAHNEEERLILDMQNLSGAFATLSGNQSDAGQAAATATGISTITQEGNKRIQEMINEFADRPMKRYGHMAASLNTQFIDTAVAIDFTKYPDAMNAWMRHRNMEMPPRGPVPVEAEQLHAVGRIEPMPDVGQDEDLNKVQKRSDIVQLTQALSPMLGMQPPPFSVKTLVEQIAEAFDMSRLDIDKLLDNSQEMMQYAQQVAMAQQPTDQSGSQSGQSGETQPTGNVGGAPGVAGVAA